MTNSKMTKRERLEKIVNGEFSMDEVIEFAKAEIAKLDAENAKRREKAAAKRAEYKPFLDKITDEILSTDEEKLCSEVAAELEVSTQKATSLLKMLVEAGTIVKGEKKVPKKGIQKTYKLA